MRLSDWPSIRLVIPLAAGIIISDTIGNTLNEVPLWCALSVIVILLGFNNAYSGSRPNLSGLCLSLSFVLTGMLVHHMQISRVTTVWPDSKELYKGYLTAYPLERERSYRLDLTLVDTLFGGKNIYLYLPKDSAAATLEPGQVVAFYGQINPPSNDNVDFDYKSYLLGHGISGTLYVPANSWRASESHNIRGVKERSAIMRRKALLKYREWGFDGNAFAVVAAVTFGEKHELDSGLREVYSVSGVSHVLAVSGLHVGIMCWFLYIIIPVFLFGRLKWLRELIVLSIMWTYAIAIGMPVSITRSLIMFSVVAVCRIIGRESSVLNSLGVAAILMLASNPSALFDMSFQLSFLAVLFIVLLTPVIGGVYEPRTVVGKYVWSVATVSMAAQIGTAPVVMYHFAGFSTYFLITNIVVVPIMFVVVALSVSLWIAGWIPIICKALVKVLTWMIDGLTMMLEGTTRLPYSQLDIQIENWLVVFALYLVILFLYLWIKERSTHRIIQALAIITMASLVGLCYEIVA